MDRPVEPPPPRRPDDWVEALDRAGSAGLGGCIAALLGLWALAVAREQGVLPGVAHAVGGAAVFLAACRWCRNAAARLGFTATAGVVAAVIAIDAWAAACR